MFTIYILLPFTHKQLNNQKRSGRLLLKSTKIAVLGLSTEAHSLLTTVINCRCCVVGADNFWTFSQTVNNCMSNVASASKLHPHARRHCGSTEWFLRDLAIFGYTKETRQPTSEMSLLDLSLYFSTSNSDSWHRNVHIFFNVAAISGLLIT